MLRRRRERWHKGLGRVWVGARAAVVLSSFLIHEGRMLGKFSVIHLLSVFTLWGLWQAVSAARAGHFAAHRAGMLALYVRAPGVAGVFTLLPGRRLSAVLDPDAPLAGFLGAAALVAAGIVLRVVPRPAETGCGLGSENPCNPSWQRRKAGLYAPSLP
jgi:uncharacterized membrane protein